MSHELTKKQVVAEIVKAGKDPIYFINNYAKISHPMKGLIPFKVFDYQEDLLRDFNDYRFNVILKARQLGISTITAAYIVWLMMFPSHDPRGRFLIMCFTFLTKLAAVPNLVAMTRMFLSL